MVNHNTGLRELCYIAKVNEIKPIEGRDRVEAAVVGGWETMVPKGAFNVGDLGIYFEIDSLVPETHPFEFLAARHYKIKIQKFKTPSGHFYSQGLMLPVSEFGWTYDKEKDRVVTDKGVVYAFNDFLTETLGVTYADALDRKRKSSDKGVDKYQKMAQKMGKLFAKQPFRWLMKRQWGKALLYAIFGKVVVTNNHTWPVGKFEGVSKTDQERIENMPWVLQDKGAFRRTEKCDGSSGTFILEKKPFGKYEFYVCSRNVRMKNKEQECYYGTRNIYWEVAEYYNIEEKMKKWLNENPERKWVCWQGEICGPDIQKNPHKLDNLHFYCFHWTDNVSGRLDILDARARWDGLFMETVPIVDEEYILPDTEDEMKVSADGFYSPSVCEGHKDCPREGYVYYKVDDPTFSFKNVSREYLLKH